MDHVQSSPGPAPNLLTPGPISSGLVPNPAPAIPYVPPTNKELEMLFQPMFDEYFNPPDIRQDPIPNVAQDPVIPTGPSVSISIDLDAPSGSHISSPLDHHSSSEHHGVAGEQYAKVNPFAVADHEPFVNVFAPDPNSEASSSGEIMMPELNQSTQPHEHIRKWTNSHPLDNIIGNPSRPLLKTVGFKPCKTKSMNLIATDVNGDLVLPPDSEPVNIAPSGFNKVQLDELGYQSRPTKKHLEAVKRVFWYLQGTINMGLWYPKDTAMALTAYADADHAGCQDTRRSTSGSAQFLVPNPMDESHYQTMACYNRILCTMTTRWP
ncbi:copia protein [Tanacetum coccineum]